MTTSGLGAAVSADRVSIALLDAAVGSQGLPAAQRWTATHDGVIAAPDAPTGVHSATTLGVLADHAPAAEIISIAVTPGDDVVRIVRALEWLRRRRVDIVCVPVALVACNVVLAPLLADLRGAGTLVVGAVGNGGEGHVCQPALDPNVFAVGACREDGAPLSFSGSMVDRERRIREPGVLDRGELGTSVACARVAGRAAALLDRHRHVRAVDVGWALAETAAPMPDHVRHRSRRGPVDFDAADQLLASGMRGPGGVAPVPTPDGPPWIDPRLRWHLGSAHPDRAISAVLLSHGTEVVSLRPAELEAALQDPGLVAASAGDLAIWTL